MQQYTVKLKNSSGTGYIIPLGPVNLVCIVTSKGLVGCGAFDVAALATFDYPAARVRPTRSASIETIDDLLDGTIREANKNAEDLGVKTGMSGKEALDLLS
ncbi:MAG TPA: YunC family protein [Methanoregulaceae archaeon]|jgi:uncharacterized protein YunC (DUF1805 family)|nr:YunC family protein [Methanolinea sp.]MCC7566777.1 YunC family protein [Methanoregulaceae archaeon]MDD3090534.1 YunC family protein [Methanoregulaceae archaeon]MDD5048142.1 YunC family protein [Methanoregulaceae archaeon]MDD5685041.1 YunC family protein [Methanoregulaceae archaeon]